MIGDLGILPRALAQREVAVLTAPDVQLVQNKIRRYARQKLRRLLGFDNAVFCAVFRERGEEIVQRMHRIAYALGRVKLHYKQSARELRAEIERNINEAVKKLPDALKVVFRIGKLAEALLVVLLRL